MLYKMEKVLGKHCQYLKTVYPEYNRNDHKANATKEADEAKKMFKQRLIKFVDTSGKKKFCNIFIDCNDCIEK